MDSTEYELVRNMTILFFFEKLMDKEGPRTLHELSCQFGARGFTKEMRQIAGGSQSGLKKFLLQYPSLFTVDGDYVYPSFSLPSETAANEDDSANVHSLAHKRNYVHEAVQYFKNKLQQYGAGTEVPIKSLLGHRSQAPPEIRHLSGQHLKDFKEFLARFPETFIVTEEHVLLSEYMHSERQPFKELEQQVNLNANVTKKLVSFCEEAITIKGPVLVEQLFHSFYSQFSHDDSCTSIFKTAADLTTFLKMHSNIFDIKSNMVSLGSAKAAAVSVETYSKPPLIKTTSNSSDSERCMAAKPTFSLAAPQLTPLPPPDDGTLSTPNTPSRPQTLKQRINSLVMKTLADNTGRDRNLVSANISAAGSGAPNIAIFSNNASAAPKSMAASGLGSTGIVNITDNTKAKLLQSCKVIANPKECIALVEEWLRGQSQNGGQANSATVLAFDCESVNMVGALKGQITLFQICTTTAAQQEQIFIFDIVTCPSLITLGGLHKLLEAVNVVKVMHDCRNISVTLYNQFGITLKNVFDTQAAHAVLQYQDTNKPVYKTKNVSLNALCEFYSIPVNPMKEQLKYLCHRDYKFWARRPLSRDMILYAIADIMALIPHIYHSMHKQIRSDLFPLFNELCEEQVYMYIRPEEVKQRKKHRKIENELNDLQMKLAASSNSGRNIVLSNREIRLLRYLDLTDEEKEKLRGSYKVAKKLEKLELKSREQEEADGEFQSLDSCASEKSTPSDNSLNGVMSPTVSSEPPSLTESMQIMDEILSDTKMDRLDKIEKLEAILNSVIGNHTNQTSSSEQCCNCHCHKSGDVSTSNRKAVNTLDCESQTYSTGEIAITNIYYEQNNNEVSDGKFRKSY